MTTQNQASFWDFQAHSGIPRLQCTVPHGNLDETERTVNRNMNTVAQRMGLAVHEVKVGGNTVQMGFGADVEAHLDRHGIGRVLDTARVFPPEAYSVTTVHTSKKTGKKQRATCFPKCPGKKLKGKEKMAICTCAPRELLPSVPGNKSIYWRLLRPELLLLLKDKDDLLKAQGDRLYGDDLGVTGLSSDGFSTLAENGGDRVKHNARIGVSRGAANGLDKRGFAAQEAFFIRIQNGNQPAFGDVEPLAQQVNPDQHVECTQPEIAQNFDPLDRVDVRVHVAHADALFVHVFGQVFGHALGQHGA